ncbi:AarF/UbiB family protein [Aestuariivirga sp. YIM B02566]|uniref:AarF/ABC1/UbiB kinase family protein n=1 Tax=Taklimakanibacter albus TaxID=2800327 RepID=A0ACC5R588_9HYPH|nr:AarF/ABC1/UbiB kinase family protein [Aestuariivirga sp. YIM B02566]
MADDENSLTGRLLRYANVGTGVGGAVARIAAGRLFGGERGSSAEGQLLAEALGNLKGPLMKVAQLLATIPDALPEAYAAELAQLQSQAPAMGWAFVKRRMAAELGPDWRKSFAEFSHEAAHAASLGQVHRASSHDGRLLACKLQYPDMDSAVEADLKQLNIIFALHRRMSPVIDTSEIGEEIAARLREELDYVREAKHIRLYTEILKGHPTIHVPEVEPQLSTRRLITMNWLEGRKLLEFREHDLDTRNLLARHLFEAWWMPFCGHGVIHGDPHLGNYSASLDETGRPKGLNLLDYGCIRIFPPRFVQGVVDLYHGLRTDDRARIVHAYETWGFQNLSNELIDILNIWARFIYGPLMEDRVRAIADGVSPAEYGRRQAFTVHRALKEKGPVKVPREFVFMDRAAIGLGGVFIHLKAELNFYRLFNEALEGFSVENVAARQAAALASAGLTSSSP